MARLRSFVAVLAAVIALTATPAISNPLTQQVIQEVSEKLEKDPNDPQLWFRRGLNYAILREFDQAIADLSRAIALNPATATHGGDLAYTVRGKLHSYNGRDDLALADYHQALQIKPNDYETLTRRVSLLRKFGHREQASADCGKLRKAHPTMNHLIDLFCEK